MDRCCQYCTDPLEKDSDFKDTVFIPRISSTVKCFGCVKRTRFHEHVEERSVSTDCVENQLSKLSAACAAKRSLHEQAHAAGECGTPLTNARSSARAICTCQRRISGFQRIDQLFEIAMSAKRRDLYSMFWCRLEKLRSWLNGERLVRFPNNNAAVRIQLIHSMCDIHGVQATFGIERPSKRNGKIKWHPPVYYNFKQMSENCHLWRLDDTVLRDFCENFVKPLDKRHSHNDPCHSSREVFVIERSPYLTNVNKTADRGNSFYETKRSTLKGRRK